MTVRAPVPGATTANGYGTAHQRLRAEWTPKVERGEVACARCREPIGPKGDPCWRCGKEGCWFDLGHADADRSLYVGPEHSCCNRATAAHRAARRANPLGTSRDWLDPDW